MDGLAGTALPEPAARFDRALVYGREWQLGHDKLPPLPWWLVEVVDQLAGRDFVYYLLAELAVIAAFALVFAAARRLVGTLGALVAVLIIDGLHYYNYTAAKFNHDVIQLPFWALAGFAFHRALRGRHWGNWLLLGLALGLSLWAKYFVVVLAVPLALFLLIDRNARESLATPGAARSWSGLTATSTGCRINLPPLPRGQSCKHRSRCPIAVDRAARR